MGYMGIFLEYTQSHILGTIAKVHLLTDELYLQTVSLADVLCTAKPETQPASTILQGSWVVTSELLTWDIYSCNRTQAT